MRKYLSYLLLGFLTLMAIGGAILGVALSGGSAALAQAVPNTLGAANFTEYLVEDTPQGDQTAHLVFSAPNRLGGWLESAGHRTNLVIIGTTEYISVTQSASSHGRATYYRQETTGASAVDPAHTYLHYYDKGDTTHSGTVTTVTLRQGGQTEKLRFTVAGQYVSNFRASTPDGTISLAISSVGSSTGVVAPPASQIVSESAGTGAGTTTTTTTTTPTTTPTTSPTTTTTGTGTGTGTAGG